MRNLFMSFPGDRIYHFPKEDLSFCRTHAIFQGNHTRSSNAYKFPIRSYLVFSHRQITQFPRKAPYQIIEHIIFSEISRRVLPFLRTDISTIGLMAAVECFKVKSTIGQMSVRRKRYRYVRWHSSSWKIIKSLLLKN